MKDLWSAVVTWLREDATLVTLTEHTGSDARIYAWSPDTNVKVPSLVVVFDEDVLLAGRTVYSTEVSFESYESNAIDAETIIERLRVMLASAVTAEKRMHGPVVDITDATVTIKSCEMKPIGKPIWMEDMKFWSHEIGARIVWHYT